MCGKEDRSLQITELEIASNLVGRYLNALPNDAKVHLEQVMLGYTKTPNPGKSNWRLLVFVRDMDRAIAEGLPIEELFSAGLDSVDEPLFQGISFDFSIMSKLGLSPEEVFNIALPGHTVVLKAEPADFCIPNKETDSLPRIENI